MDAVRPVAKYTQIRGGTAMKAAMAYDLSAGGRSCEGWSYGRGFAEHVRTRVKDRCDDDAGTKELVERLREAETAGFDSSRIEEVLSTEPSEESWRMGECMAECFLEDQKGASLPNPRRALKNPRASPAGADLVGFLKEKDVLFLFGEVKTAGSGQSPPPVMTGMASQLEKILSSESYRNGLIQWLAFMVWNSDTWRDFSAAMNNYLDGKYRIVGALIRDTRPQKDDISSACSKISLQLRSGTLLALYALYLPVGIEEANGILGS